MQLAPLLSAVPPIPSHAFAALAALALGIVQLVRRKGTPSHRWLGRVWVTLLTYVAVSGLFINEIRTFGPYSWIHLLSIVTLVTLFWGVYSARRGRIAIHKRTMTILYWLSLVLTGMFTFLPGRTMYLVVFG